MAKIPKLPDVPVAPEVARDGGFVALVRDDVVPEEVGFRALAIMQFVLSSPRESSKVIGAATNLRPGTVSRILDDLEARAWVVRRMVMSDRRLIAVTATEQGRKRFVDIARACATAVTPVATKGAGNV
jgi:hypothetical protein